MTMRPTIKVEELPTVCYFKSRIPYQTFEVVYSNPQRSGVSLGEPSLGLCRFDRRCLGQQTICNHAIDPKVR
jgi:hypothetical protein